MTGSTITVAGGGIDGEGAARIGALIRAIPDYPSPGVTFRDITGLLADGPAYAEVIEGLAVMARDIGIDVVAGMEARGFIVGAALATRLGVGFVPLRKAGKLPPPVDRITYALEYGTAAIEARHGSIPAGARVLVVDDVLATGGTASAGAALVESGGGRVAALLFLMELVGLGGRERLAGRKVEALLGVAP